MTLGPDATTMDGGVVLAVSYRAVSGTSDQVAGLLADMAAAVSEHEPGCLAFEICRSVDDPNRFLLYEHYIDETALDRHRDTAHFRDLIQRQIWPLLESREPERYDFVAGRRG